MVSSFGVSILLTGLPGAGKTTMALGLEAELLRHGHSVTVLDGDELRRQLSSDLGFSRALIAPYGAARESAREAIEQFGGFVEEGDTTISNYLTRQTRNTEYMQVAVVSLIATA